MTDDGPSKCPKCRSKNIDRDFSADAVNIVYTNRPPWTYKEALKFKDCRIGDGPRFKIDPNKHGDRGSWHSPGDVLPFNKEDIKKAKRKRRLRELGG